MVRKVVLGLIYSEMGVLCSGHLVYSVILAVTLLYQLGPEIFKVGLFTKFWDIMTWVLERMGIDCQRLLLGQVSILEITTLLCKHFYDQTRHHPKCICVFKHNFSISFSRLSAFL
jgi:hypothetical protein